MKRSYVKYLIWRPLEEISYAISQSEAASHFLSHDMIFFRPEKKINEMRIKKVLIPVVVVSGTFKTTNYCGGSNDSDSDTKKIALNNEKAFSQTIYCGETFSSEAILQTLNTSIIIKGLLNNEPDWDYDYLDRFILKSFDISNIAAAKIFELNKTDFYSTATNHSNKSLPSLQESTITQHLTATPMILPYYICYGDDRGDRLVAGFKTSHHADYKVQGVAEIPDFIYIGGIVGSTLYLCSDIVLYDDSGIATALIAFLVMKFADFLKSKRHRVLNSFQKIYKEENQLSPKENISQYITWNDLLRLVYTSANNDAIVSGAVTRYITQRYTGNVKEIEVQQLIIQLQKEVGIMKNSQMGVSWPDFSCLSHITRRKLTTSTDADEDVELDVHGRKDMSHEVYEVVSIEQGQVTKREVFYQPVNRVSTFETKYW